MSPDTSACNNDCLMAVLQDGTPKGSLVTVGSGRSSADSSGEAFLTYASLPPGIKSVEEAKEKKHPKIILWCCDVFGPRFVNNQVRSLS